MRFLNSLEKINISYLLVFQLDMILNKKTLKSLLVNLNKSLSLQGVKRYAVLNTRRGARVVMEQFAKLSTGDCRQGSSPCLSANFIILKY